MVYWICQDLTEFGFSLGIHRSPKGPFQQPDPSDKLGFTIFEGTSGSPTTPKVRSKEFKCKPWRFEDGDAKKLRNTSGKVSNKLPAAFLLRILRLEEVSNWEEKIKNIC